MKQTERSNLPRAGKDGDRTGSKCPLCGEDVLRQDNFSTNGSRTGSRLVCAKRGCPWQGKDR
jgi:hypothetical protein